ncbi:MAG: UDP-glucose--hexose-1-phosphate uridylyltransferase [Oscillospiraceae bacterium]|nr:UDP-glucose--hexose-1-phosphate uridylyltransferase [Oscillospiraceae bacterium]
MKAAIDALIRYGLHTGLIREGDEVFVFNRLLEILRLDEASETGDPAPDTLAAILERLTDDAVSRGVCEDNITARDLFDTALMGALTPWPHEVRERFSLLYAESPLAATDWYYRFSCDTNYIRRDRIAKDVKWVYNSEYGPLDITINLSKPEKDPRAIAAARLAPQAGYPKCQLCAENEGYAGRMNHPARQNHRVIPVTIAGSPWYWQYSPYVYYNEHCIVFNAEHTPMKVDKAAFRKLFDFITLFPHYFVGSNADLPIVGGSILSHDHFQGGHYEFAMAKAPDETELVFKGFEDVRADIVKWPMSVIRLTADERERIVELADKILGCWRGYTDESAMIYSETEGTPHNTITPIARRRGSAYQLDLVLRNNLTTEDYPLGLYHPHQELHHIKKENIGLIEVMGLAVLPSRLKTELAVLKEAMLEGRDLRADPMLAQHADWAEQILRTRVFQSENADAILREEVGRVFMKVLEHAGVYKRDEAGRAAFLRFIDYVNQS